MAEIIFKAGRKRSLSCPGYRQIIKSGATEHDMLQFSDDAIILDVKDIDSRIIIDCAPNGEFHLKFTIKNKLK